MKFRKLRITWSVAWGVVAVLLFALWLRSYWWSDFFQKYGRAEHTSFGSEWGSLHFERWKFTDIGSADEWTHESRRLPKESFEALLGVFKWQNKNGIKTIDLPHWSIMTVCIAFAALPWLRWRFSLRTLLIATTLVAVGLGTITALSRL